MATFRGPTGCLTTFFLLEHLGGIKRSREGSKVWRILSWRKMVGFPFFLYILLRIFLGWCSHSQLPVQNIVFQVKVNSCVSWPCLIFQVRNSYWCNSFWSKSLLIKGNKIIFNKYFCYNSFPGVAGFIRVLYTPLMWHTLLNAKSNLSTIKV